MKTFLGILFLFGGISLTASTNSDSITVLHTQGTGDGNIYVTIMDSSVLTGDNYEVYFDKQNFIRNEDGIWVFAPFGKVTDPNDLTGSTIDISAIYGDTTGVVELSFLLLNSSHNSAWIDGVSITFPTGITIIDAPEFEAEGGTITPLIEGQTISMGLVDGQLTQNGIFHGWEEWSILVSSFEPPLIVDWTLFDDGWEGQPVNVIGQTTIDIIGYEMKTENHWNVKNLTTSETVLEDQTVIMGYDLYTGDFAGDPIIDGFKISVDVNYENPRTISRALLNGDPLDWYSSNWDLTDYTIFGTLTGTSNEAIGYGTYDPNILQKDYNIIWSGELDSIIVNEQKIFITKEGTGSLATLFQAQFSLANHPLNPNPGSNDPFLLRVPFEVWNIDDEMQVNYQIRDRMNYDPYANGFKVWNDDNRMYGFVINTPYIEEVADPNISGDFYTWNHVWYKSHWQTGDVITIIYSNPTQSNDKYNFSTPDPVVSVEDETIPLKFELSQNYPNPFNPTTAISYSITDFSFVTLKVFDVLGKELMILVNEEKTAGNYTVDFQADNFSSGIYFYKIEVNSLNSNKSFVDIKKMILLK